MMKDVDNVEHLFRKITFPPDPEEYLVRLWAESPTLYEGMLSAVDQILHKGWMSHPSLKNVSGKVVVERGFIYPETVIDEDGDEAWQFLHWSFPDGEYKDHSDMNNTDKLWFSQAVFHLTKVN